MYVDSSLISVITNCVILNKLEDLSEPPLYPLPKSWDTCSARWPLLSETCVSLSSWSHSGATFLGFSYNLEQLTGQLFYSRMGAEVVSATWVGGTSLWCDCHPPPSSSSTDCRRRQARGLVEPWRRRGPGRRVSTWKTNTNFSYRKRALGEKERNLCRVIPLNFGS